MKLLFAHDHVFKTDSNGNVYSSGKLPYKVWQRYLSAFDSVKVISRSKTIENDKDILKLNLSSGPSVDIVAIPSINNPIDKLKKYKEVTELINESLNDCDALIARLPSEIGSLSIEIAEKLGKPWAVEVVACTWDSYWNHGRILAKFYAPFITKRIKKQIAKAEFCLYVTENILQSRYPNNGENVSCSNVELIMDNENVVEKRLKKIRDGSLLRLGLIGSLSSNIKGIDTALKAIHSIKNDLPPFQFDILGDGNNETWLQLARKLGIDQNVRFVGVLPSGKPVLDWLDEIDIYIQPSYQEGLPRAVIEAMSRGCTVLGSTAGGIPELIGEEFLHKPRDSKKLGTQILSAVNSIQWRSQSAIVNIEKSRQYSKERLDKVRKEFWVEFATHAKSISS